MRGHAHDEEYEQLPREVKSNLSLDQFRRARQNIIREGDRIPESTQYINLKNGLQRTYQIDDIADGPLFPMHELSGATGKNDSQWTQPPERPEWR